MGGPLVVLPVSGFLPVPLPMMIPFMGAQSLVIGKMFGEGFQYGKRKISAMPNEEFNKLTFEDMMSNARVELKSAIPTINASMQDMDKMVEVVVNEFLKYLGLVTKTVLGTTSTKAFDIAEAIAHSQGTHLPFGHDVSPSPTGPESPEVRTFVPPTNIPIPKSKIPTKITEPRFQRVSTQTLKIERNKLIRDIAKQGIIVKNTPKTINQKRRTTVTRGGSRGRVVYIIVKVENPTYVSEVGKLKSLQRKLTSILKKLRSR